MSDFQPSDKRSLPTPRTDALYDDLDRQHDAMAIGAREVARRKREHAENLERELAEANERSEAMEKSALHYKDVFEASLATASSTNATGGTPHTDKVRDKWMREVHPGLDDLPQLQKTTIAATFWMMAETSARYEREANSLPSATLTPREADLLPGLREALRWKPNTPQLENAMTYAWEQALKSFVISLEAATATERKSP